jgi:glycosyltransferase involved in cell wall biosynthesis
VKTSELGSVEISVVIPVYNEVNNLEPLQKELTTVLQSLGRSYEIIYVDDGSTDGSYAVLTGLHAAAPEQVKVIRLRRNFGQTAAFTAGFDYAHGAFVVTLDADGQNDPADSPRLLAVLEDEDCDIVIGWRVQRREPLARRILSSAANWLISRSTHVLVHDRGCSLKVYRSELVKSIRLYGQLHRFLPELSSAIGMGVKEVPVNDRARNFGRSKYGALTRTPRVLLDLVTVVFLLTFFSSPMRLFGSAALVSGGLGVLVGGSLALAKIYNGLIGGWAGFHSYQIGNRPLLLLAVLLVVVGTQFLMMGLLGEMVMRTYYEAQGKPTYTVRQILE